jgi:hypothetical protein
VIVDKAQNSTTEDEPRVKFDYSQAHEEFLGYFLGLSSKFHNYLVDE